MIHDVVIVGAGPNGLMLACELSLAGVRPVVLESRPEPGAEPRANGLVGQVVRILDRRGLYERITGQAGPPVPAPAFMFAAMHLDLAALDDNPLYTLPVPQARLVQILADRAAELGVEVRHGHELTGLTQDDEAVTLTVAGPDGSYQARARYLAGADGGHSITRKRSGIGFPGVTRDHTVSRTMSATPPAEWIDPVTRTLNVPGYGPVPLTMHHRTETGMFTFGVLPGRPPIVVTTEYDPPDDTDKPLTLAEMEESIQRVLGVAVPLTPPPGDGPQVRRRLIGSNTRLAERYRDRRVVLVGDAAHVHSAAGGPGLNLGLQDAVNLGWKLAAAVRDDRRASLLDTYESERRPVAERVIMQTQAQSALTAPGPDVTALRQLFGELLADPRIVAHLARTMAGSDVRYEAGEADKVGAHPLTGRLAPDLELRIAGGIAGGTAVGTAGGPVRLAQLTREARPLLLDLTEKGLPADGPWELVRARPETDVSPAPGADEKPEPGPDPVPVTALLLRPDTYVAWASSSASPDTAEIGALRAAADRWLS
jgi:2-polyprenyl-6-methoxyphenol hydroxylase-like FAD-dependent oxidoreductase